MPNAQATPSQPTPNPKVSFHTSAASGAKNIGHRIAQTAASLADADNGSKGQEGLVVCVCIGIGCLVAATLLLYAPSHPGIN